MQSKVATSLVLLALCISGCNRGDRNGHEVAAAGKTPAQKTAALTADPASVRLCEVSKHLRTVLHWDVTASGAHAVVVTVTNPKDGSEKRFGHGGPVGTKETGPWLRPGVVFKVRNQDNNVELGAVTIKGIACN